MFGRFDETIRYSLSTEYGVSRSRGDVEWKASIYQAQEALRKVQKKDPGAELVTREHERKPYKPNDARVAVVSLTRWLRPLECSFRLPCNGR